MGSASVHLIGNVGRDPEMTYTKTGTAKLRFSVGVTGRRARNEGEKPPTTWFAVEVWGKLAEALADRVVKGGAIYVAGGLSMETWTGRDGTERSELRVNANQVELLGERGNGHAPGGPQEGQGQPPMPVPAPMPQQQAPMPQQQAPMPQQQAPMPQQQAPMPQQQAPMQRQQAPMPQQQAPMPQQQAPMQRQQMSPADAARQRELHQQTQMNYNGQQAPVSTPRAAPMATGAFTPEQYAQQVSQQAPVAQDGGVDGRPHSEYDGPDPFADE